MAEYVLTSVQGGNGGEVAQGGRILGKEKIVPPEAVKSRLGVNSEPSALWTCTTTEAGKAAPVQSR